MPAGERKIPEPMVEPMSTAIALARPSLRGRRESSWEAASYVAGAPGAERDAGEEGVVIRQC